MLNTTQQTELKTYIEANATWMAYPHTGDGAAQIAVDLQAEADFWVWRSSITEDELTGDTSVDATDWDWGAYKGLTAAERDAHNRLFNTGTIDPSKINVRSGFNDAIYSGGTGTGQREHFAAIARRKANLLEELFSIGTGSTALPATMNIEGNLAYRDVLTAMWW